jgi:hypothetical protein
MNNFDDIPTSDDAVDTLLFQVYATMHQDLAGTLPVEDGLVALIGSEPVSGLSSDDHPKFIKVVAGITALPLRERLLMRSRLPMDALVQVQIIAGLLHRALIISRFLEVDVRDMRELLRALVIDIEKNYTVNLGHTHLILRAITKRSVRRTLFARNRASDLVVSLAYDLDSALDGINNQPFAHHPLGVVMSDAIWVDLYDINRMDPRRAIANLLAYVRSVDVLVQAVDNVEGADLTQIELGDLHLTGVRWSEFTTRWPPEWEEPVRKASVRIDQDRGLWEIRDDPRAHDRRDTQVTV